MVDTSKHVPFSVQTVLMSHVTTSMDFVTVAVCQVGLVIDVTKVS